MKIAGWKLDPKGKRTGQATPQKARQHRKKIQALRQHLKQQTKRSDWGALFLV
jgi:hypothetical protein